MRRHATFATVGLVAALVLPSASANASPPLSRHTQVAFADSASGFITGVSLDGKGYVARTGDGGSNFVASQVSDYSVSGLGVASASTAWAVSTWDLTGTYRFGTKTVDFGASWVPVSGRIESATDRAEPYDVAALSAATAFVGGKHNNDAPNGNTASIWRTTDSGASWAKVYRGPLYYPDDDESEVPQTEAAVVAMDRMGSALYALVRETYEGSASVKSNYVVKSVDNGSTWATGSPAPLPIPVFNNSQGTNISTLADLSVATPDVAWAAGPYTTSLGQVYRTTDGHSWAKTSANPKLVVNGIDAFDANRAVVVGDDGKIALTVNGGASWTSWTFTGVNSNSLQSVSFCGSDPNRAVAVGDDQLIVLLTFGMNGSTPTATGVVKRSVDGNLSTSTKPVRQSTSLTIAVPSAPSYASAKVVGQLTSAGAVVPGRTVTIERSTNGSTWTTAKTVTTDANGAFSWAANPTSKTWYQAKWVGDPAYSASRSAVIASTPKVALGVPVAPKTMKAKRSYTVYGSLKPRHTSGTKPIRIYKYKKVKSKGKWVWKSYGYVKAVAYNFSTYSRYKAKMSLPSKGSWRLRAYAPADSKHAATWTSKYDYVTVK